jgi:macrolide-specific efflux system membrane fusion protein
MNQHHTAPPPSESVRRSWHSRRSLRYAAGLLALAALAAAGWFGWQKFHGGKSVRDQYVLATVQRGDIEDLVSATGTVQPRDYVDVGAQVSGQLKKIHVEVGSVVSTGDLLAEIDATVLAANVDARRASLRNLRATMKDREAQLALAQLQFQRQQNLMAEDATTAEALQQAEAALRSARAQLEAVKAQIDQTDSSLRADEANLNYTRIYAPMAGTVVSITARQGQTINANQSAPIIMRIADLSTMTVQTQVSEADVGKLRQGMDVYFTTLGSQGRRWSGQLRKVEPTPTVTNNVVLYNALFDVPNVNRSLMTQMTAQVFFIAARAGDTLLIPASALQGGAGRADRPRRERSGEAAPAAPQASHRPRRATVKVIDADGHVEERQIETGVSNRVQVQVLSGLTEGDQVIAGVRPPPSQNSAQRPPQQGGLQQGPMGMPPGGAGGGRGR